MLSEDGLDFLTLLEESNETTNYFWTKKLKDVMILEKKWLIGTTDDENKVKIIIDEYCHSLPCDFVRSHPSNMKQKHDKNCAKSRILWQMKDIPFNGIPFSVVSHDVLKCTFSMDYHSKKRRKIAVSEEGKIESDDNFSYDLCPAKITIKKLIRYPSFSLPLSATKQNKLDALKNLKQLELDRENAINTELLYWIRIPLPSYHNHSFRGKDRTIHRDILQLIKKTANSGITSPDSIKEIISNHVKEKFMHHENPPLIDDEAYYPSLQNINFVIYNATTRKLGTYSESNDSRSKTEDNLPIIDNIEICSKSIETPSTLEDVVQAFCLEDPLPDVNCSDAQSLILTLREKIGCELSRIMQVVNTSEDSMRLEYIWNSLSMIP